VNFLVKTWASPPICTLTSRTPGHGDIAARPEQPFAAHLFHTHVRQLTQVAPGQHHFLSLATVCAGGTAHPASPSHRSMVVKPHRSPPSLTSHTGGAPSGPKDAERVVHGDDLGLDPSVLVAGQLAYGPACCSVTTSGAVPAEPTAPAARDA
jgi:hypothetical protein